MEREVANALGERLDYTFHAGAGETVVVIGHGVTGNKDRPFAVALAEALSAAGIAALRFSFSGNGDSEGRFEDSTVTKEVRDLNAVLDALEGRRTAYVGHSQGGAVGVLRAAADERLAALVSLAGMVHVADFCRRKFGDLDPGHDVMWERPECPLSRAYVEDMERIGSVVERASQVRVPWLLVHGTADTVVPFADSEDALARAGSDARLVPIDGGDHVFTGDAMAAMTAAVVPWLAAALR